jgi:hypothetical protein
MAKGECLFFTWRVSNKSPSRGRASISNMASFCPP